MHPGDSAFSAYIGIIQLMNSIGSYGDSKDVFYLTFLDRHTEASAYYTFEYLRQ